MTASKVATSAASQRPPPTAARARSTATKAPTSAASVRSRDVHVSVEVRPRSDRPSGPHATAAGGHDPGRDDLGRGTDKADHRRRAEQPVGPERPPATGEAHDRAGQVVLPLGHPQPPQPAEHDGGQGHGEEHGLEGGVVHSGMPSGRWRRMTSRRQSGRHRRHQVPDAGATGDDGVGAPSGGRLGDRHGHLPVILTPDQLDGPGVGGQRDLVGLVDRLHEHAPHDPLGRPVVGGAVPLAEALHATVADQSSAMQRPTDPEGQR